MHSTATVAEWLERIIGHEGGYTADPNDPGNWTGEQGQSELRGTKYGISARAYPYLDIESLTADEAASLYITDYLAPLGAHRLPDAVAYLMLDLAINSGVRRAVLLLQEAVGTTVDGVIGPKTLEAVERRSEAQLAMKLTAKRLHFLSSNANWPHYGKGWVRRVADGLEYAAGDV